MCWISEVLQRKTLKSQFSNLFLLNSLQNMDCKYLTVRQRSFQILVRTCVTSSISLILSSKVCRGSLGGKNWFYCLMWNLHGNVQWEIIQVWKGTTEYTYHRKCSCSFNPEVTQTGTTEDLHDLWCSICVCPPNAWMCHSVLAACRHQAQWFPRQTEVAAASSSWKQLTRQQSATTAANSRSLLVLRVFNTSWHWIPNTSELIYLLKMTDNYCVKKKSFTALMCAEWKFQSITR